MDLNYQDHELFKDYILSYLKNKKSRIELLIEAKKCNIFELEESKVDEQIYIDNLSILIHYLQDKKIFINNWKIKSNIDLFINSTWFSIMDLLQEYFKSFHAAGNIFFTSDYYFCKNENNKIQVEKYINLFKNINVSLMLPYYTYFNKITNDDNIFNFIKKYRETFCLILNPEDMEEGIKYYKEWKKQINRYNLKEKDIEYFPGLIINQEPKWTEENIDNYLTLIQYIINDRFSLYDYNIENFTKYVLSFNNNCAKIDPLIIEYYDKYKDNSLPCILSTSLAIDCKDLSFPTCCGLCHPIFNGGKFLIEDNQIIDIIANEGINGFLNQKMANSFFMPDCYACENKYFCKKGCRGIQFEYHTEPFLPKQDICTLFNSKLNLLVKIYHELHLFDELFKTELNDNHKYELIQLLRRKGYPEYECRYC